MRTTCESELKSGKIKRCAEIRRALEPRFFDVGGPPFSRKPNMFPGPRLHCRVLELALLCTLDYSKFGV